MRIYRLSSDSNVYQSLMTLNDADEETLWRGFRGRAMAGPWKTLHVKVMVDGDRPRYRAPASDFPSLRGGAPVFSNRAVEALCDILQANGELFPLRCDEVEYQIYNVLTMIDALDMDQSVCGRFSDGSIISVHKHVFKPEVLADAMIFKIPQIEGIAVYVTEAFKARVEELKLTGFRFYLVWDNAEPLPAASTPTAQHQTHASPIPTEQGESEEQRELVGITSLAETFRKPIEEGLATIPQEQWTNIYAISFYISDMDDDPRRPTLTLGFNTDSYRQAQQQRCGCSEQEAKWNYAYWEQNELALLGEPGTPSAAWVAAWVRNLDLYYTDEQEEEDFDRTIEMGEEITKRFVAQCCDLAAKLHQDGLIVALSGRPIPILIHELEYYDEIADQTEKANPPGIATEFVAWIRGDGD